jgi:hypothetical protein
MKFRGTCFLLIFLALAVNANATGPLAPNLGAAGSFAVLGGTGITSADAGTTIVGDVGSCPTAGAAITGLLPVTNVLAGSTLYPLCVPSGPVANAKTALTAAYLDAQGRTGCTPITGDTYGNAIVGPGLYCASSALLLTGTLTLNGGSTDTWIFQVPSALTAQVGSSVVFSGGASPCNVFWQVGSSAFITTNGPFAGTIMALTSITLNGGILNGRALARNGLVSISQLETIINGCSGAGSGSGSTIVVSPVTSSIVCSSGSSITKTALVLLNGVPVADGTSVTFTVTVGGVDTGLGGTATTIAGIATFTFTPSASLTSSTPFSVVARLTDGTGTPSNITNVTCSGSGGSICATAPPLPTVSLVSTTTGPPKQVIFKVQAAGGLFTVLEAITNGTFSISPFDKGTTQFVGVTVTKIDQSARTVVALTVTDQCGGTITFDPVFATITIPASKSYHHAKEFNFNHREVARFDGIGHTEGIVLLQNDTPGVALLVIRVNGSEFKTRLSDGETKKIDISSALFHGTNTVRVAAFGRPKSSVDLTISDGK